jgi:alkylation response protein AidB-like acyl-CoA dehydrogenase
MNVQKAPLQNADYCPPPPEGDFYRITDITDESERTVLKRVRDFMDREVAPIIEDYWVRDQFPFDLVPKIAALGIGGAKAPAGCFNGEKKWIGNATFADINIIWAREESSGQVKGFVVAKDNPGFAVKKIEHKMALRVVQNGLITLKDWRVLESDRLQNANSFRDTAKVLRMTRAGVAWFAVGCGRGAYQHALRYATQRLQFGRPIAGFQLVQDLLVRMLGNVTATQCLVLRLGQLQT